MSSAASTPSTTIPPQCSLCRNYFDLNEIQVLVEGFSWHQSCFRCSQCFCELLDDIYYIFEGRVYCEHDFKVLYAPVCGICRKFVTGKVRKSLSGSYHPECFRCQECNKVLEEGVWFVDGRMLCLPCRDEVPRMHCYVCIKCRQRIVPDEVLRYKSEFYHAYHFNCHDCKNSLTAAARQKGDVLYCLRCYDKSCEICPGCKRAIDPQVERSVFALRKHWHVEHFCCYQCGKAFHGEEFFEIKGKAYCTRDYLLKRGDFCYQCGRGITGKSVNLFEKTWCPECYRCVTCDAPLISSDEVAELDLRPMCKKCFKNKRYQKILKQSGNVK